MGVAYLTGAGSRCHRRWWRRSSRKRGCGTATSLQNPYHVALAFGLERISSFLRAQGQGERVSHIVFECRGKKEDQELALEFERVCAGANYRGERLPFEATFADKKANCCGLQLADLFARPIGRKVMSPQETNRAYDILQEKFYRHGGRLQGFGLKIFP